MPSSTSISLRHAVTADIPAITTLLLEAMPQNPQWTYRYPYAAEHPAVHRAETQQRVEDYMLKSEAGMCITIVAEAESARSTELGEDAEAGEVSGLNEVRREIVGVTIMQLPGTFVEPKTRTLNGDLPPPAPPNLSRPDAHPVRLQHFVSRFRPAQRALFTEPFGSGQVYVDFVAVAPRYQRRGIARKLVGWVLDQAREEPDGKVVTLFSSPAAEGLYLGMGFREVGRVDVGLPEGEDGGGEGFSAAAFVWWRDKEAEQDKETG